MAGRTRMSKDLVFQALKPILAQDNTKLARFYRDLMMQAPEDGQCQTVAQKLAKQIESGQQIEFVLPAFPAKSENRQKTISAAPDWGEISALQNLQKTCERISLVYQPGAKVVVASDGRVFVGVVGIQDQQVDFYRKDISSILNQFSLSRIETFGIDCVWPDLDYAAMRQKLDEKFATEVEAVREACKEQPEFMHMYNGIHRFLFEDYLQIWTGISRNQVRTRVKPLVYKTISRSNAWSKLVEERFPGCVRLSIHPHANWNNKLPTQLVPAASGWATPWHNAPLMYEDGRVELIRAIDAQKLGAKLQQLKGFAVFAKGQVGAAA